MLPLPELHRDRQPGLRTGNGYLPYGLSSQMGLVRQRQGLPYKSLHTAPEPSSHFLSSESSSHFHSPGPSSHFLSPGSSSHFRNPGSSSHFRSPESSSHFLSPGPGSHFRNPEPSSHFRSQGPSAKAAQYRKRGRFCAADSCKRATGPYLCRSRRP